MGKDKSAAADKREQVLPAKTEKNAAVETSAAPAKKSRAAGMLRLAAAVLLILAASAAALLYYQKFGLPAAGSDTETTNQTALTRRPAARRAAKPAPAAAAPSAPAPAAEQPREKITEIKYVIPESVTNAINGLHDKVGKMETLTAQYMNINADSSAVISLGERLDELEKRTRRLSRISNDGALVLTAALMIRENAAAGQPVRFEAEMLKQLAAGRPEIETAVDYVYNNSSRQYPSNKNLTESFNRISGRIVYDLRHQGSWKDRLLRKINEYIHISSPAADSRENAEITALEEIKGYVDEGQFAIAVELLSRPENETLLADEALNKWFAITDSKLKFNRALSEISAYSLALMKTEGLKNAALP